MLPRFLIVTDQADFARLLEHHVATLWDEYECKLHGPASDGRLEPGFVAAGYDALLLDANLDDARGIEWLQNLVRRPQFPPVMFFTTQSGYTLAKEAGAAECFTRERIDHERLAVLLRKAVGDHKEKVALARGRKQTDELYRFGPVMIRGQRFIRELATGGTASVYLAESEKTGERIVLKVLNQEFDSVQGQKAFDRFLQEYELLSHIRHPNVVRIHDLGLADDHAYIAMEYFPLGDLRTRLLQPIAARDAAVYVRQMAAALAAVHQVGILHRDLKPGNVMLRPDGAVALIDFGLAKQQDNRAAITAVGEIFGTPYYISPEQGHGQPADARSDLYSLGVIFFEMLTRRKPYLSASPMEIIYMHRNAPLPPLEGEGTVYQPIVHRLMAKRPADRFQSADEALDGLDAVLA